MRYRKHREDEEVKAVSIRLPIEVYEQIRREASRNGRSMNAEVQKILAQYIDYDVDHDGVFGYRKSE